MQRTTWRTFWYSFLRSLCRIAVVLLFRYRVWGTRNRVPGGSLLICSNHQSHFDPVLIGVALRRQPNYLARESLFRFAPFRWLIWSLNAIPIDREGMGLTGIKETLKRLKRDEAVVIFPEGTRTRDGELAPLKPGFCSIARRGKATLLPVGIDGAFDAWPREQKWPGRSVIHVCLGEAIRPDEVRRLSDDELVAELERRMRTCFEQARRARLEQVAR
jgi:1-acyl-sn-glycerol-3-phosphate acyltransferase